MSIDEHGESSEPSYSQQELLQGIRPSEFGPVPWMKYAGLAATLRWLDAAMSSWAIELYRLVLNSQSRWNPKSMQRVFDIRAIAQSLARKATLAMARAPGPERDWLTQRILKPAQDIELAAQEHIDQTAQRRAEKTAEAPDELGTAEVAEPFDPDTGPYAADFRKAQSASIDSLTTVYRDFMRALESKMSSLLGPGAITYIEQMRLDLIHKLEKQQRALLEHDKQPHALAADKEWIELQIEVLQTMQAVLNGQRSTAEAESAPSQPSGFRPVPFSNN